MIEDKLNKDIQFAKNCGYDSALIMTEENSNNLNNIEKKYDKSIIKTSFPEFIRPSAVCKTHI